MSLLRRKAKRKPRICILADRPGWAYDNSAMQIKRCLSSEFDITIQYDVHEPTLSSEDYDLLHICFWGSRKYQHFKFDRKRIIKQVSSHRWQDNPSFGPFALEGFARRHLNDCDTVNCTSHRLTEMLEKIFPRTFHTPNGVNVAHFKPGKKMVGTNLVFGWAGNVNDKVKGFRDIVEPACIERFPLVAATGDLSHGQMEEFYRGIDVILVASRHEGEPLTLIEAMASGCFPVCVDVGIVPELIEHERNGYIVPERSIKAFQTAFEWCEHNRDKVRAAGFANAEHLARTRNWDLCAQSFARVYRETLTRADHPSTGSIRSNPMIL